MAKKRNDKLTDNQEKLLRDLSDDNFKFPGRLEEQSYQKLVRLGFAESDLLPAIRNNVKGTTEFRRAFKRTPEGKEFAITALNRALDSLKEQSHGI